MSPLPRPHQEIEGESADLFDYALIKDWIIYARGAVRRRKSVVLLVASVIFGASVVALVVLPKTYHVEVHIQAQRSAVIGQLGTGRQMSWDWEEPARSAPDLILRSDNLVNLVRETQLVHRWNESRAPVQLWKDALMEKLRGPIPDSAKEEMMVGTLEQKLSVVPGDGSVVIGVDWTNPQLAYRICEAAQQSFLEARKVAEVAAVSEAIGLLESHAADVRANINRDGEQIMKMREHNKGLSHRAASPAAQAAPVVAKKTAPPDPELSLLRAQLQGKQNAIEDLEDFRRRRIAELQNKLSELKQIYSEFHPAVVDLQEQIQEQEKQEPIQLTSLRGDYKQLEEEYLRRGGTPFGNHEAEPGSVLTPIAVMALRPLPAGSEEESPEIEQAKSELSYQVGKYQSLQDRVDVAKMERDTQRAAFSYRYGVLRAAAIPSAPEKPKKPLVLAAGLIAGIMLGLFAALLAEIRADRIVERWQIERLLGIQVLAEIRRP